MTSDEHEFVLDLTLDEVRRRALVLEAIGSDWDPIEALEGEEEAYRRLYADLDPEQERMYEVLVRAGVIPPRPEDRRAA